MEFLSAKKKGGDLELLVTINFGIWEREKKRNYYDMCHH